jgi:hypothetical protein
MGSCALDGCGWSLAIGQGGTCAGNSYWLVNAGRRPVDWWRIRVIKVIGKGTLIKGYAHREGMRVKK